MRGTSLSKVNNIFVIPEDQKSITLQLCITGRYLAAATNALYSNCGNLRKGKYSLKSSIVCRGKKEASL